MDWEFIESELLEVLDQNGVNPGTVDNLEKMVENFVNRLSRKYGEEAESREDGIDA